MQKAPFTVSSLSSFSTEHSQSLQLVSPEETVGITPVTYQRQTTTEATVGGVSLKTLAKQYGTPLYVLDEATLRQSARAYQEPLTANYPGEVLALFAAKANLNMGICKLVEQEGLGIDVVSGGELQTCLEAGFPKAKILFNGNNKSEEELSMAIQSGVGRIIVDNLEELGRLDAVMKRLRGPDSSLYAEPVNILIRVAPGIECHTHEYLKTGNNNNKFGVPLEHLPLALKALQSEYAETIRLRGLHAHIGSQIFEPDAYLDLVEIMLNLYQSIQTETGMLLDDLDIGGGIGIRYTVVDDPPDIATLIQSIAQKVASYAKQIRYPLPRLIVEPGRSLVATAGMTLYTIGGRKEIPGGRTFVSVDGGMGDNIRPALYRAAYTADSLPAEQANNAEVEAVTVVGKYCESGDVLFPSYQGKFLTPGDLFMVFGTGAYNYTMSSNYNRIPRPAVVLVNDGQSHVLVKRETYQDILAQDLIPKHLM